MEENRDCEERNDHSYEDRNCGKNNFSSNRSSTSASRSFQNPFESLLLPKLRYPVCSPNLFTEIPVVGGGQCENYNIPVSEPCDFDESVVHMYDETLDPETEKAAQEAISEFFENESGKIFSTPDKVKEMLTNDHETTDVKDGEQEDEDDISPLRYVHEPSSRQLKMNESTTWAQTHLTLSPKLPEEVEAALQDYMITQFQTDAFPSLECMMEASCMCRAEKVAASSRNYIDAQCQTELTIPTTLPQILEQLLSPFETFFEVIYTDLKLSMLKRQLFSEEFRKSSLTTFPATPVSPITSGSPLLSSSMLTPLQQSSSLRHFGSPVSDITSPENFSPIARPERKSRNLSRLNLTENRFETSPRSPSVLAQEKNGCLH